MKIEIDFDIRGFETAAEAVVTEAVGPAIVDALNAAAEAGRIAVVEAMPAYLDRPTPYTTMAVGTFPAAVDRASGRDPEIDGVAWPAVFPRYVGRCQRRSSAACPGP